MPYMNKLLEDVRWELPVPPSFHFDKLAATATDGEKILALRWIGHVGVNTRVSWSLQSLGAYKFHRALSSGILNCSTYHDSLILKGVTK